jgi:asparagine synthase (glutamine-hydrolysing)
MCGIVGIVDFKNVLTSNGDSLKKAVSTLSKRGPDGNGIFMEEHVAFGHARLAVIDTSVNANQPFTDNTGNYTIIFNGEFYNYKEHRQKLEQKGHKFRTHSDTEVLLSLYIEMGIDCLSCINGDFAFAIYDKIKQQVFIARDRYGIKPLVYYHDQTKTVFASEIKGILPFLHKKPDISNEALSLYLQLNYIPAPLTIYSSVYKIQPGHYLIIDKQGFRQTNYYSIPQTSEDIPNDEQEILKKFKELLMASVERRLISDVPLGTFLSGGIDSSIITAISRQFVPDLSTFTIGFNDYPFFDESKDAERIAKHLNTNHHTLQISEKDLLDEVPSVLDYLDEPFADSSAVAVSSLAKYTKKHITVALSGDGADELHGGYNKHKAHFLAFKQQPFKSFFQLSSLGLSVFPASRNNNFSNKIRLLHKYSKGLSLDEQHRYWYWACFNHEENVSRLFQEKHSFSPPDLNNLLTTQGKTMNDVLYNDMHLVLPNDMLFKTDSMSMMHGLEVRVPMLDHTVVNFVSSLPSSYKINNQGQKLLLRKAFGNMLPQEILKKPKHGFEIPLHNWLKGPLDYLIQDLLNEKFIKEQNLFNFSTISVLLRQLRSVSPSDSAFRVWNLLVFQYWWKKNYYSS